MTKSRKMRPHLESLGARTLPAAGPLGIDVGTPEYVDMIKQSGGFYSPVDSRGWPAADDSIVVFDDRVNEPWNGPDPNASQADMSGTYHLSFQGQASVSASWPATIQNAVYNASTNITTADVVNPVGNLFLQLTFYNTVSNPGGASDTGVTNVRLIRPGYATNTSQEFTNQYIAALEPFNTIRTLDATNANSYGPEWAGVPLNWSQRHLPTDATTGADSDGRVGATSWEDLIALANATHTNLWINIPGPATDDYITQLANLIKNGDTVDGIRYSGLDPSLKVYVEWSNEVWGGVAATYNYNVADMDQQLQQGNSILTADGTAPIHQLMDQSRSAPQRPASTPRRSRPTSSMPSSTTPITTASGRSWHGRAEIFGRIRPPLPGSSRISGHPRSISTAWADRTTTARPTTPRWTTCSALSRRPSRRSTWSFSRPRPSPASGA